MKSSENVATAWRHPAGNQLAEAAGYKLKAKRTNGALGEHGGHDWRKYRLKRAKHIAHKNIKIISASLAWRNSGMARSGVMQRAPKRTRAGA